MKTLRIGCYWCKHRSGLMCYSPNNIINLGTTLKACMQPLLESSLRDYVLQDSYTKNGRMGDGCRYFQRSTLPIKEKVVFT